MKPIRVTPPAAAPVSLEEVKAHVRVDWAEDDGILQAYLDAAVAHLDGWSGVLGRCLVTQTWKIALPDWRMRVRLPFPDVTSALVRYYDAAGAAVQVDGDVFDLVETATGAQIVFLSGFGFPALDSGRVAPVEVEFVCGFGGTEEVPAALKVAILQLAATWYERREAVTQNSITVLPLGAQALIAPYQRGLLR